MCLKKWLVEDYIVALFLKVLDFIFVQSEY